MLHGCGGVDTVALILVCIVVGNSTHCTFVRGVLKSLGKLADFPMDTRFPLSTTIISVIDLNILLAVILRRGVTFDHSICRGRCGYNLFIVLGNQLARRLVVGLVGLKLIAIWLHPAFSHSTLIRGGTLVGGVHHRPFIFTCSLDQGGRPHGPLLDEALGGG